MKKTALALGLMVVALPVSNAWADFEEERELEAFSRIKFDGLMDVVIEVGEEQSVTITANKERYLSDITTRVSGDRLIIDTDFDSGFFTMFKNIDISVHITVPSLEEVELDGLGDIVIRNLDQDEFKLTLDGMGSVEIGGTCGEAVFTLDGLGDLNARNLKCKSVRLSIDGMGDADIYASDYAEVYLDGMGDVDVYGDPKDHKYREDGMGDIDEK